jgi:predicted phage tail protein
VFTKLFLEDSGERAVKTFAQALLGVLLVQGATIATVHWGTALAAGGTAALISLLTSVVSFTKTGSASLVEEPHGKHEAR